MSFNMYSCLDSVDYTPVCQKKYAKKLREISKLKQKKTLSPEEIEKIKMESGYKKLVGTYVPPLAEDRNSIMNKLPDDVLFVILSYMPYNIRLICLKPFYNKMFSNISILNQIHEQKRLKTFKILNKIAILAEKVKRIYSPDYDRRLSFYNDIRNVDAIKYYYYDTKEYYKLINDVCKHYTVIYTGTKKYKMKDIAKCESNIFKIYLNMAALVINLH